MGRREWMGVRERRWKTAPDARKRVAVFAIVAAALAVGVMACAEGDESSPTGAKKDNTRGEVSRADSEALEDESVGESGESASQQEAREMAKDYVDTIAISRTALIEQLEDQGFSHADAVYAVAAFDWHEQAVRMARDYLDLGSSRRALIHQLEFEGYSHADAVYAVDVISPDWNEQAVRSAKGYRDTFSYSRKRVIHELEREGFTPAQAEYGVQKAYG